MFVYIHVLLLNYYLYVIFEEQYDAEFTSKFHVSIFWL